MSGQFNRPYPTFLGALLRGEVDVEAVILKLVLVSGDYVFDDEDEFLADIDAGDRLATSPALTSVNVQGPQVFADSTTFPSVDPVDAVEGVVLFVDTGSSSTSRLAAFYARKADTVPLLHVPDGGEVTVSWPAALLKI